MLVYFRKTVIIALFLANTGICLKAQTSISSIIAQRTWNIGHYDGATVFYAVESSIILHKGQEIPDGNCHRESLCFSPENDFYYCEPFITKWVEDEEGIAVEKQVYTKKKGIYQINELTNQLLLIFDTTNLEPNDLVFRYLNKTGKGYSLTYHIQVLDDGIKLTRL